jgi:hypothetical protein
MSRYFFLAALLAAVAVPATAGEESRFSESTLAYCPVEFAPHEVEWTAECLVNAIRAWNIGALKELTADSNAFECRRNRPCHENFVFGPAPWKGAPSEKRSLFDMVAMARTISIEYVHNSDGSIEAIFYPGWSRGTQREKPELSSANWMNQFFVCDMEFDADLGVWLIADDFCHAEIGTTPRPRRRAPDSEELPRTRSASDLRSGLQNDA